jgi:hypothetical protein
MDTRNYLVSALLICACTCALAAKESDPTPRKSIDPREDAKIRHTLAQRWRNFGAEENTITRTVNQGAGGNSKGCSTTIGPALSSTQQSGPSSGRYGPQPKPSTVVVTGSVINACK